MFLCISIGDFIKNWGKVRELGLLGSEVGVISWSFPTWKDFEFKNCFSCEPLLVHTIMIHNRKHFYPSNLWSQRGFIVDCQRALRALFWELEFKWPSFDPRSKVDMASSTYTWIGSFYFGTKQKSCQKKIYALVSPILELINHY